jgi:acyl-CoA thioesterase
MGGTPFELQTSVEAVPGRPGSYRAEVTGAWNAPILPHGGILTALALRAMAHELSESEKRLRSVTTVFAAQVLPGAVEIDVTVLRRGRAMSQVTATLRMAGAEAGHTSVGIFGVARPGYEFTDIVPPDVPGPGSCRSMRDPLPEGTVDARPFRAASFWQQVEARWAKGHSPWEHWVPTTSERATWLRFDEPPFTDDGILDPLAVVALCDTMPGAVGERVGPGQPMWFAPSADLTVHVLGDATSDWLLANNRARFAGDGYASLELALWDPQQGLVAYGTQMMLFSFPDGPPSPEQRRPPR